MTALNLSTPLYGQLGCYKGAISRSHVFFQRHGKRDWDSLGGTFSRLPGSIAIEVLVDVEDQQRPISRSWILDIL